MGKGGNGEISLGGDDLFKLMGLKRVNLTEDLKKEDEAKAAAATAAAAAAEAAQAAVTETPIAVAPEGENRSVEPFATQPTVIRKYCPVVYP